MILKFRKLCLFSLLLLFLLVFPPAALARPNGLPNPPVWPDKPYGTVKTGAAFAPVGTEVSAWCGGIKAGFRNTEGVGSETWYYVEVLADNPDTPVKDGCVAGDTVVFKVGEVEADQTKPWISGENERLDLTYSSNKNFYLPIAFRKTVPKSPATGQSAPGVLKIGR